MSDSQMFPAHRAADGDAPTGDLEFACPRCGQAASARYWGPCPTCREALVSAATRESRTVETGTYEPKMNVVPNQVATKD